MEEKIEILDKEQESGLVSYAKKELDLVLKQAEADGEEAVHMQKIFNDGVLSVVKAFSDCGHSGFTASLAIRTLDRLLNYRPLTSLTLEDDEWEERDEGIFQNKRASNVFKQADKFEGKPYCIDGPNGEIVTLEEYPLSYIGIFTKAKKEHTEDDSVSGEKLHQELIDYLHELYKTKNKDYGNSVHDTYEKYGLVSFLVRMEDKLNRAKTLSEKEANVADEKLEDTLLDLANYAILAAMEVKMSGGEEIEILE